eukprot:TRINITY_DN43_c2_g1_i2.p1 TRINITY_DN43_c2_g1~~TRINITY_DN43_c2_g1_i2.p1  ORF type:complete len:223 (-),score=95.13 TRINITY_DN43_c2_g1_i2:76-744(-)
MSAFVPKLYTYTHCPFCVRVLLIANIKNFKYEEVILANHDEENPIRMVGSKQVPILEYEPNKFMPESLDIVKYIDNIDGKPILETIENTQLKQWIDQSSKTRFRLIMPRVTNRKLIEFTEQASVDYFTHKKEQFCGPFSKCFEDTPILLSQINNDLIALEQIFVNDQTINGTQNLTYDDVSIFAWLLFLTFVKDLQFPPKIQNYINHLCQSARLQTFAQYSS